MISLFKAFEYADAVGICQAEFKDSGGFTQPSSAYQDRDYPKRDPDGTTADQQAVDMILITISDMDPETQFEEQYITLDSAGVGIAKDTQGKFWALRFRMHRPVTEDEVREHQVRQLISR